MPSLSETLVVLGLGAALLLLGTLAFDALHVLLHRWASSRWPLLRRAAGLHAVHHAFLDRDLCIHADLIPANVICHVVPEYLVQLAATASLGALLQFPLSAIVVAVALETLVFALIMKPTPGFDVNHRHIDRLQAYRPLYFCLPEYHLLHHVYPDACFGSWVKTLDHWLATGTAIRGRRVALTGGATVCGGALRRGLLRDNPVVVIDNCLAEPPGELARLLGEVDILVLCHAEHPGPPYRDLIELFYEVNRARRVPVEVWAVARCSEFQDNRASAEFAQTLFRAGKVIYRHLVMPANPAPGDLSRMQARIRKGYNYVAACWDATTFRHCLRFLAK